MTITSKITAAAQVAREAIQNMEASEERNLFSEAIKTAEWAAVKRTKRNREAAWMALLTVIATRVEGEVAMAAKEATKEVLTLAAYRARGTREE